MEALPPTLSFPEEKPASSANPASRTTVPVTPRANTPGPADRACVPGYEVLGELGRGGMGVVYKARQLGLNRLVALKMILGGLHASEDDLARFRIEAEAVARLDHPGIVNIYDIGVHDSMPFFSLEFCPGGSLAQQLQGKPLPGRQSAELIETAARAMHAAHQAGILHRDLKPGNILLMADGKPKITDFGLAKIFKSGSASTSEKAGPHLTQTGAIMGTPSYMAPEQAGSSSRTIGPTCDVYGLGAILYEMITGRPPFQAASHIDTVMQVLQQDPLPPRMLNPEVEIDLEKIALKCLEKQPTLRYATAEELADDLHRYLTGEPITARSVNLLERLQRELTHSQHDTYLRPWGFGLMLLSLFIFITHLATSLLLLTGLPRFLCFWGPRSLLLLTLGPLIVRYRPRQSLWPTNAVERHLWALLVGYVLTFLSIFWVMQVLEHDHLQIYGVVTAISGLAWFTLGGYVWGGCYLIGLAFLMMAPVMAFMAGSLWSPFVFGVQWSAALLTLGRRYWKLGQQPR
jgi:serine/threonine protein kinase